MGVPISQIEPEFERLRQYILNDLTRIIEHEVGGNYAAMSLIACACDALARLRYGQRNAGDRFFADMMPAEPWNQLGRSLYDALRDGLVHTYETKEIQVGRHKVTLVVSWKEKPNLTLSPARTELFINVREMATVLQAAFQKYKEELLNSQELRDRFYAMSKKDTVVQVQRPEEIPIWDKLLGCTTR